MLSAEQLFQIVNALVGRPGHEKVRALVLDLLVYGLGANTSDIHFEQRLPEVRGRLDALLGQTVFEFKRDLRLERADAEEELSRYLLERERATGQHFVGIATDGAEFVPYELSHGRLVRLTPHRVSKDQPHDILIWLDAAVSVQPDLSPDPATVQKELGRGSLAYEIARSRLLDLWQEVKEQPDVRVKRQLWADLLQMVYGSNVDADELFVQHTYLTLVAKTMATRVLGIELPAPSDLLSGKAFHDAGISGAVESDFFDWVLAARDSSDLVTRIARQVARFRLQEVHQDVLKGLYESLIDPEQRHDLGEYYTPDWLAARVCDRAIAHPLEQRIVDPACGSGTFLFHAVRRLLSAADSAGMNNRDALSLCCTKVLGIDVHPVAVLIARVTYLLSIGEERLRDAGRAELAIPVYLGDSLQWNTRSFLAEREVLIGVPDGPTLHFPAGVVSPPSRFDSTVRMMLELSEQDAPKEALVAWLQREGDIAEHDLQLLAETYEHLCVLRRTRRDHIWGYVARNLTRPLWLSSVAQQADVVVGNPPWLSYRYMSSAMQQRFRAECQQRGLWMGGKVATHQDLSAYFFARCAELYLQRGGTIAFVMPYAALDRHQFGGFRTGWFGTGRGKRGQQVYATVRFKEAWAFDENLQPLFPVPSCVLFVGREESGSLVSGSLPATVVSHTGVLPRRDATPDEADAVLQTREIPWPRGGELTGGSPYREVFHQGATFVPRMLCVVEPVSSGHLGSNVAVPLVESRRTKQEKPPWRDLPTLRDTVEAAFLRTLYLGESVAPFRILSPALAVVPWEPRSQRLLDSAGAQREGYPHLAKWLQQAEDLWRSRGRSGMTFLEQLDYYGKLTAQLPPKAIRVVYAKSGTLPAAAILRDQEPLVDHTLYWTATATEGEAYYLASVLSSETARQHVARLQARGQWGARHFDKLMFELPIPRFAVSNVLHCELNAAGRRAEEVAGEVGLPEGLHFVRVRARIRDALREDGVAQTIEALVERVLSGA